MSICAPLCNNDFPSFHVAEWLQMWTDEMCGVCIFTEFFYVMLCPSLVVGQSDVAKTSSKRAKVTFPSVFYPQHFFCGFEERSRLIQGRLPLLPAKRPSSAFTPAVIHQPAKI